SGDLDRSRAGETLRRFCQTGQVTDVLLEAGQWRSIEVDACGNAPAGFEPLFCAEAPNLCDDGLQLGDGVLGFCVSGPDLGVGPWRDGDGFLVGQGSPQFLGN